MPETRPQFTVSPLVRDGLRARSQAQASLLSLFSSTVNVMYSRALNVFSNVKKPSLGGRSWLVWVSILKGVRVSGVSRVSLEHWSMLGPEGPLKAQGRLLDDWPVGWWIFQRGYHFISLYHRSHQIALFFCSPLNSRTLIFSVIELINQASRRQLISFQIQYDPSACNTRQHTLGCKLTQFYWVFPVRVWLLEAESSVTITLRSGVYCSCFF